MNFDPAELDSLSREELILRARARGVERPELMTRVELRDEIVRLSEPDLERQRRSRGWLGVARDLLASVVESGLNLPDAAAAIRGDAKQLNDFQGPPPVATVTLAEIYAAQGHYEQALRMLDEVIEREPEHGSARSLRDRIAEERDLGPGRRRKVVETKAETVLTPVPPVAAPPPSEPAPAPSEPAPAPAAAAPPPAAPEQPAAPERPAPPPRVAAEAPQAAPTPAAAPPAPEPAAAPPVVAAPVASPEAPAAAEAAPTAVDAAASASLLVLQTADRAFVYWRLSELSEALRVRSITVQPSSEGPRVEEADYPLPVQVGGFWLSRMAPGSEVRAALGELSEESFNPLAVARVVCAGAAAFEPPGSLPDLGLEAAARSAAGL